MINQNADLKALSAQTFKQELKLPLCKSLGLRQGFRNDIRSAQDKAKYYWNKVSIHTAIQHQRLLHLKVGRACSRCHPYGDRGSS